jgi:hypothetical protein
VDDSGRLETPGPGITVSVGSTDTTPPTISNVQAGGITTGTATISWTTSEPADSQVEYGPTTAYGSSTTLDPALVLTHSQQITGLTPGTTYHYRVKSKDGAGNLAASADLTFVTASSLDPQTQPILTIVNSGYGANPFNRYLPEMLRAEGLMGFQTAELSTLMASQNPTTYLRGFKLVILGETPLSTAEAQVFRDYVSGGGRLVAMRPDTDLLDIFGVVYAGTRTEQVLQFFAVDTSRQPGAGITGVSLQYHGQADNYNLNGGTALAYLWNSISSPSTNPAAVINTYGQGQAAAFAFDLARSIVLMRQGNPAWKNTEGDGLGGYRATDLLVRADGTKWVAPERMRIPQADETQRFLANLVQMMVDSPLPRLWYLPNKLKVLIINTGDGEDLYGADLQPMMNDAASYGGRVSNYLRTAGVQGTDPAMEASWRAAGHEVGPHMYADGSNDYNALLAAYRDLVNAIQTKFGHGSRTARHHTVNWTGWSEGAEILPQFGTPGFYPTERTPTAGSRVAACPSDSATQAAIFCRSTSCSPSGRTNGLPTTATPWMGRCRS